MTVEACPDIEAAVERVETVAKSKLALLEAITDVYPGMRTSKCPDLRSDLRALLSERKALREEIERLKGDVCAFAAPWAVEHARNFGLPEGHLFPNHYDILERAGARMVSFTRSTLKRDADA